MIQTPTTAPPTKKSDVDITSVSKERRVPGGVDGLGGNAGRHEGECANRPGRDGVAR